MNPFQEQRFPRLTAWKCPKKGVIKINVDGALGNPSALDAEGLLRDSNGTWLIVFFFF